MDEQALLDLWRMPESELTEWKPSLAQTESLYRTICAFSNDYSGQKKEGVIFVGRENDGKCADISISDKDLLDFVGRVRTSGSILPLPDVSYREVTLDGCSALVLIVKPSHSTPVQYGGAVYIRQGNATRKAAPTEITTLTEKRTNISFDGRAVNGADYDELDDFYLKEMYIPKAVSRDILLENGRTLQEQLASLRILTPQFQPTNLGLLVAGKDVRRFLPGAYIQFLRIDGLEISDPVRDHAEISGRVSDMLRRVLEKITANIQVAKTLGSSGQMVDHSNYPFEAIRELIANAVVHRNYETTNAPIRVTWFDDRIEIQNPGGPYGNVTEQNFGQPHVTDYRNPELSAALKYLGYVERFGSGIAKVRRLLRDNGNPDVQFEPRKNENYVLATVRHP